MTDETAASQLAGFVGKYEPQAAVLAPVCIDEIARKSPGAFELFYDSAEIR
jgi:hypothetical protein